MQDGKVSDMLPTLYSIQGSYPGKWIYGREIVHGYTGHLAKKNGRIQLERLGPHIPMFTISSGGLLIVTDEGKQLMLDADFSGLQFEPVDYANIVDIDWENFEIDDDIPYEYEEVDFSALITDPTQHCEYLLPKMPDVFAVKTTPTLPVSYDPTFRLDIDKYANQMLINCFSGKNSEFAVVNENGRKWFERNGGEWLVFPVLYPPPENRPIIAKSKWM